MDRYIAENEVFIRLSVFFGLFFIVALWEVLAPKRTLSESKMQRWTGNLSIVVINTLIVRLIFPVLAVGMAVEAQIRGWGLFNNFDIVWGLNLVLSVILLDFVIYLQHVMFHAVPLLWRLHRMHHTDLDYDVTTGSRFHPVEIILSMLIKLAVIVTLGPVPAAVVVFEVLLNGTAMFNHGNIRIPKGLDRIIRWFVVTPDMHRVHHSILPYETNSNFGFNLPWWDRLFGTYRDQPEKGHEQMTIGIELFRRSKYLYLHWMLIQPFLPGKPNNAIIDDQGKR
jgi:sterol desaturase/sphingolipid hydroxylase (fatty acid hydroxylase superfamily)